MKPRTSWLLAASVATAVLALVYAFAPRPVEVEVGHAVQGRFETWVEEDAKTRLRDRYVVSAPLAGRLQRIVLREGDRVTTETPVAQILPELPALRDERTLRELRARVDGAYAALELAGSRVEHAAVQLERARSDLRRSAALADQGFVAPSRLESDRLTVQAAQKNRDAADAQRSVSAHELEQARAALGATTAAGPHARRAFVLRAPVDGQVLRVLQPSETDVALGTPLVELGDTGRLDVVAELLTPEALAARPGSPVRIERWGGPGSLEGQVERVEPGGFTKISALGVEEQRVRVIVRITSPSQEWHDLGDGFRVTVRIVTSRRDDALQVPVSAVFPLAASERAGETEDEDVPHHAVFAVADGRARRVPVRLLGRNETMAWVQGGLTAGTAVVVYPPPGVRDGGRLRPRRV